MANASVKAEIVSQLDGFGNKRQKFPSEHFRSSGFSLSPNGMSSSLKIFEWEDDISNEFPDLPTFQSVLHWATGLGRPIGHSGGDNNFLYMLDEDGNILQSLEGVTTPELVHPHMNSSHFSTGYQGGLIVDQKNRLLYPGERYLGRFDPSIDKEGITFTATNGSDDITNVVGMTLDASVNKKFLVYIDSNNDWRFWRIDNFLTGNSADMYGSWTGATGTYTGYIMMDWDDNWKDFGSDYSGLTSEGYNLYIPTETYEDTVLFMRENVVTSLNTLTDTVTTDASPAFTMPTGFDPIAVHRGSNGILFGYNFQRKGVLVLWDNYSDRSIAPWIPLPDRLISVCKYNGGWIVITAREIYYTNGYSLELLATGILDMDIQPLSAQLTPQTSVTVENHLYFIGDFSYYGKRRGGIYRMNLETKLVEFIPREDLNQFEPNIRSLFYGAGNGSGLVYANMGATIGYVTKQSQPAVATFITNPVGQGANKKHAEAVKLDLGIQPTYYEADSPFSFEVAVKICPMREQIFNYAQVKVTQTVANQITVNETLHETASVGDEIEFLEGNNAGYSRNITAITGGGTATAVYTLDRDLPALSDANDYIFRTKFRLVSVKTFTNITEIDPDDLYFEVKNRHKGKRFMLKVDIEDSTVPIELRPMQFIYSDLGVI